MDVHHSSISFKKGLNYSFGLTTQFYLTSWHIYNVNLNSSSWRGNSHLIFWQRRKHRKLFNMLTDKLLWSGNKTCQNLQSRNNFDVKKSWNGLKNIWKAILVFVRVCNKSLDVWSLSETVCSVEESLYDNSFHWMLKASKPSQQPTFALLWNSKCLNCFSNSTTNKIQLDHNIPALLWSKECLIS